VGLPLASVEWIQQCERITGSSRARPFSVSNRVLEPKKQAKGNSDWRLREHLEFIAPKVLLEKLSEAIELQCFDSLVPSWEKRYAELAAFKEANGHCDVPRSYGFLYRWCASQRSRRQNKTLIQERIALLDVLGFCWDMRDGWDKMYAKMAAFKEANGHCNVSRSRDLKLGNWICVQREYRKKDKLSPERIALLDALGFCWDGAEIVAWNAFIAELEAFHKIHGHYNVPRSYDNGKLAIKVTNVRKRYRNSLLPPEEMAKFDHHKDTILSPWKIAQLEAKGFCFDPETVLWEKMYAELKVHVESYGNCQRTHMNRALDRWVTYQRIRRRKNCIPEDQIAKLDAINFPWITSMSIAVANVSRRSKEWFQRWEQFYNELVAFKEVNGHCNPPYRSSLHNWCADQRDYRKKGTLGQEQIAKLDALGFRW
jgi:hypothetical protein